MKIPENRAHIFFLTWATVLSWVINYLYHPIMLRFLSIEDFGKFESLVSIFNILWVITTWLIFFLNKEISRWHIESSWKIISLFKVSFKWSLFLWVFLYWVFLLFSWFLAWYLRINDVSLVRLVWMSIIFAFVNVPFDALLRGLKKFKQKSLVMSIMPFWKLILWVILVWQWYHLYGAVAGFVISTVLWIIVSYIIVRSYIFSEKKDIQMEKIVMNDLLVMKKEIFQFCLVSLLIALFMNMDMLLARNLFDATTAWIYSWVSIVAKFLVFILFSVETVYYSQIMESKSDLLPVKLLRNPILIMFGMWFFSIIWANMLWSIVLEYMDPLLAWYNNLLLMLLIFNTFLGVVIFISKILIWYKIYVVNSILLFWIFGTFLFIYGWFWIINMLSLIYILISSVVCLTILLFLVLCYKIPKHKL